MLQLVDLDNFFHHKQDFTAPVASVKGKLLGYYYDEDIAKLMMAAVFYMNAQ